MGMNGGIHDAMNLANKLASDGNIAMIGTSESADSLAMAPIMAQNKIPMITSGQSPKLGELHNSFVFLNSPPSSAFDETLAKYLVTTKGLKDIAMISNNGAYGAGERTAFTSALKSLGITPLSDQVVTPDQKDFSSALTAIRGKNPKVLFIGAEEVETGLIVKQARQLGIDAVIAGGAPAGTPVYVKTAGVDNAEGTIVSTPYLGNDINDQTKKFAADYKAKYNETGEFHGAKAYDGAKILIKALQDSKVASGQKLSDAIRAVKYDGLVGHFDFDENGIGVHETQIGVIDKDGNLVPVNGDDAAGEREVVDQVHLPAGVDHPDRDLGEIPGQRREVGLGPDGGERAAVDLPSVMEVLIARGRRVRHG